MSLTLITSTNVEYASNYSMILNNAINAKTTFAVIALISGFQTHLSTNVLIDATNTLISYMHR